MSEKKAFVIVGMAGSGKSTFTKTLSTWLKDENPFVINLDPATLKLKFSVKEDIREKVNYKEIMNEYSLGPNGAIITCLNLYMLNINEMISKLNNNIIIDTPGQIEAITWSSPGEVLISVLKQYNYKVYLLYIIDTPNSSSQSVFMSNMIYASAMMTKFDCELICVFNKTDLSSHNTVLEWIRDYELFHKSLNFESFRHSSLYSMSLYFEEFYKNMKCVAISALNNKGKNDFFKCLEEKVIKEIKNKTIIEDE